MPVARTTRQHLIVLLLLTLAGLALRLLVWHWREFYPLGGDENDYFNQALTLLQGRGYVELPLMRPPLYTVFLALIFQLCDSQVQRVRLVQALISTGTIPLVWLWTRQLFAAAPQRERSALLAAGLTALCYTFAANATELLTETLFLAGLTLALWLIVRAGDTQRSVWALTAGLSLGALCLLRAVALPLLPLALLWLLLPRGADRSWRRFRPALVCGLAAALVIAPWTLRNLVRYDALIIIDTTGAENLWLDNDPAGREAVKRQLYALGEDRGLRQRLAMQRGWAAISADPARFLAKAWREAQAFVALEYFDDLQARRAIWVRPADVWLRLLLGDGLWLIVLLGGSAGLWLQPATRGDRRWLLVPWTLYVALTGLVFHVELRYRLPLYPALLPYAAAVLAAGWWRQAARWQRLGALLSLLALTGLLLLHRPYPGETWRLARKHLQLWQAERAWRAGRLSETAQHARAALQLDPASALARVWLGLAAPDPAAAAQWWRAAIETLPAHPYAHLLLGNHLRAGGDEAAARRELAYETHALEDLQRWALHRFASAPRQRLDIGDGLDLGYITGFYPAADGARWTGPRAAVHGLLPGSSVQLRLRSPRPPAAPAALVEVWAQDRRLDRVAVGATWQILTLELPPDGAARPLRIELRTPTFRPRAYDRASPDNRALGVEVDWIQTLP